MLQAIEAVSFWGGWEAVFIKSRQLASFEDAAAPEPDAIPMRILLFSTLFPNAAAPAHGVFVENRLAAFRRRCAADVKVVAPVPWFPFGDERFGAYGKWADAPQREIRRGVEVLHPRYFIPPKAAMRFAPAALARCLRKAAAELIESGWDFDLIDAHYFYPDGVAAAQVARQLGKPVVITARGSDVTQLPAFAGPREKILDAARRADAVIAVAEALKRALTELGAPAEKIAVLRNGVDLEMFHPGGREALRRALGLDGPVLASVGHLIKRKGHDLVIDALKGIEDATLLIAGEGPERAALESRAARNGVTGRVRFLGGVAHDELRSVYAAADVLVLASSREGWPNVLLEAMACGTPCVATNAGGSSEAIAAPEAGRIAVERNAAAIAAAVNALLTSPPERKATRAYAERHSWDETADGMAQIFEDLTDKSRAAAEVVTMPIDCGGGDYLPRLIVTVDTEEQFDWRAFDRPSHSVNVMDGVERFQSAASGAGVRPLYFLTWPILNDEAAAPYFQGLYHADEIDAGLHLHQWATPPGDFPGEFYSFQKNLPRDAHMRKLHALADRFGKLFGERALSHRAGRYGISKADYDLLAAAGIRYDFSPSAKFDFSARGGPDFAAMSNRPFAVSGDDWRIAVTPVCGARAIKRTRIFLPQDKAAPGFASFAPDWRDRFSLPMRLSPEGATLDDLKALTRRLVADGTPVLTFTLHSTSLTPGANDYASDIASVDRLLTRSAAYFDWFRKEIGGDIVSLTALRDLYDPRALMRR
jgi:glycosyltransferase involved in cell wall biosynthesis